MKTLIATCSNLTNFDGKSLRLIKYADVLHELGHDVDFIVLHNHFVTKKFTIYETKTDIYDLFGNMRYKPIISEISNIIKLIKFGFVILYRMLKNDYQIVITSAVSPDIAQIFALIGCRIKNVKHVYDYDDLAPEMSTVMKGWDENHPLIKVQLFIEKWICSKSFKTIAMSNLMKDKIARSTPLSNVEVIYNVPLYNDVVAEPILDARGKIGLNKQKFIFCYIGNVQRKIRSLEIIIDAADKMRKEKYEFQILIIGHGSGSYSFKQYVDDKGLSNYFIFTGEIEKDDVIKYVNASNVSFVLLAVSELGDYMAPAKLFVSMGVGKNIIATNTTEVRKILGDKAIYVNSNPTDIELANAMIRAIRMYSLTELNHEYMSEFAKKYNWDVGKKTFLNILDEV